MAKESKPKGKQVSGQLAWKESIEDGISYCEAFVDFGILDKQGRKVGALLSIREKKGMFYGTCVSSRDGRVYGGGLYNPTLHKSLDEAKDRLIDESEKRKRKALKSTPKA